MKLLLGLLATLVAVSSGLYQAGDMVVDLTDDNFAKTVMQSEDVWIVEFYAPWCGHCQSLAPEYKKAARALRGVAKVGGINADEHKSLAGRFSVQGFPTLKIFGLDKNKPKDYNGARSAQGIVDNVLSEVKSVVSARLSGKKSSGGKSGGGGGGGSGGGNKHDVVELTDGNFDDLVMNSDDMWLVEFFAPWCGHCKNLAPHWADAATQLKGKVKLGALDATVHQNVAGRYGIRGYPTIKHFPAGSKGEPQEYDGGRTGSDIVAWALDKVSANVPPPEVLQLTDPEVMKEVCEDKQLCVLAFLPHILDCQSECRNEYLTVLTKMADHYKQRMWGWAWAEGATQPDVEEALGIGGFGYPAMAAMNTRKLKYAPFKGSFGDTGIHEFLRDLAFGRGSTVPVSGAKSPTAATIEPWDGKDGELPVEDDDYDDIDLDDIDLDKLQENLEKQEL